jgi:hypothetical protein
MKVHTFDNGFEAPAVNAGRELVPDGTHAFIIREASEGPHKFPETYPGDFLSLTLATKNGNYGFVWVSLGTGDKDQAVAASLATALGMSADEWADAEPGDLAARSVRATTRQVTSKMGRTRVYVNQFLPIEEETAKKPAARTPAQKVAAAKGEEAGGADEIPF